MTGIPLAWDAAVTLTASYQKVFSDNPKIGFFAQRDTYKEALDAGEVLPPATSEEAMQEIVTNSTVDGVLAALFAVLIIVVILDASRIWIKAIRAREPLPDHGGPGGARADRRAGRAVLDRRGPRAARRGGRERQRRRRFKRDREEVGTGSP